MLGRLRVAVCRRFGTEKKIQELEKQVTDLTEKLKLAESGKSRKFNIWALITEKGVPFGAWYLCVYLGGIGTFYGLLKADVLSYTGIIKFAKSLGADSLYNLDDLNPSTGQFAVAFLANELAEPLRLPLALVTLNPALRLFRRFRPPRVG